MTKLFKPGEEEQTNVVPLFVKPNMESVDEDWLKALPVNTMFLSREKGDQGFYLLNCQKLHQAAVSALVKIETFSGQTLKVRVDTLRFSRGHTLVETLGVVVPDNKEKQNESGD